MKFVPCTEEYWEFVRTLRTDARVEHRFNQQQVTITKEQQRKYMIAHWQEYFIALVDLAPAGYAGCVDGCIRVCTHPDFQRRGVASFMIEHLMTKFPTAFATIRIDNEASRKLFEACGFVPTFIVYDRPREQNVSRFIEGTS
jgi:GNAT superfamily N-acetyltransferase